MSDLRDYDVAVLDRGLPEIDGIRLMELLDRRVADLQVVFLSGYADPGDPELALDRGAFAYLAKPCRLAEILSTIERAVERRRELRSRRGGHQAACSPILP